MFALLEERDEIAKAQSELEDSMRQQFHLSRSRSIGYPSNTVYNAEIITDGRYWHRTADYKEPGTANPRRLNWFGVYREPLDLEITVEVNVAYSGNNGNVAGFFARDTESGLVYLMHTGRVGGGRKGVGKDAFLSWAGLPIEQAVDLAGNERLGVIVMPVTGRAAALPALNYIRKIAEFKLAVRGGLTETEGFKRNQELFHAYYAEGRGRRRGARAGAIDYLSRHGDVVDALHSWRTDQGLGEGSRIVKNVLIDMGVAVGDQLSEIYEAKTGALRGDLYAAIGQVMVHGATEDCRRTIALPAELPIPLDVQAALVRMQIHVLRFTLDDESATILPGA